MRVRLKTEELAQPRTVEGIAAQSQAVRCTRGTVIENWKRNLNVLRVRMDNGEVLVGHVDLWEEIKEEQAKCES